MMSLKNITLINHVPASVRSFGNCTIHRLLLWIVIAHSFVFGQTIYYVSSSTGNDANNGTSTATPWKTPNSVTRHAPFQAGDQILFKRGDVFQGEVTQQSLVGTENKRILFGAYGSGEKPIIYGDMTGALWTKTPGRTNIWQAFSGSYYSSSAYEDSAGIVWHKLSNNNQGDLHFYLNRPDSLQKFLNGLTPSSYGYGNDTVWVRTWDGNAPKVHIFHEANFIRGNYVTIRDWDLRNFGGGIVALSGAAGTIYTGMLIRNVSFKNIAHSAVFLTGRYYNCLVDSCTIDSTGYTAIYNQFGKNNVFRYNTVSNVGLYVLGIYLNDTELCGIGMQQDTNCVAEYNTFTNVLRAGIDTYFNINDTVRYNTIHGTQAGIYLNGSGWVAHNNTVTTTIPGGPGMKVTIHGTGLTSAYDNNLTVKGDGQTFGSSEPGGGTVVFRNNKIKATGATNTRFCDYQEVAGLTSTDNSFLGVAVFNIGKWPIEHIYTTLTSFKATGFENGSENYFGTGLPTGTFTVVEDTLPASGGTVMLQWTSLNTKSASISYKIGGVDTIITANPAGSVTLDIFATTQFTLTLSGPFGTTQLSTSVIVSATPEDYYLQQNYPNPFTTSTTIEFGLPKDENISIKIFDLNGREIITLYEGMKLKGVHQIQWNTTGVASGVYRYRLSAGTYSKTRRMVLVK